MREEDVVRIIQEERERNKNYAAVIVNVERRIIMDSASRIIQPTISEERWKFFLKFILAELLLSKVYSSEGEAVAAMSPTHCFDFLKTLEEALLILRNEWEHMPEQFKERHSKEALLEMACSLSVSHDTILAEYDDAEFIIFAREEAGNLMEYVKCAEVGFVGYDCLRACTKDANIALNIMKIHLADVDYE